MAVNIISHYLFWPKRGVAGMPSIVKLREPYQGIYDSFCFRPGLATNESTKIIHETFNGVLRGLLRQWAKQKWVPSRDQIASACERELAKIEASFAGESDDYKTAKPDPERLDALFSSLEFFHTNQQFVDERKVFVVWKVIISLLDASHSEIELLKQFFGGSIDHEAECYTFVAGKVIAGPRFLSNKHEQIPAVFDQVIGRQARDTLNQEMIQAGILKKPFYKKSLFRKVVDSVIIARVSS